MTTQENLLRVMNLPIRQFASKKRFHPLRQLLLRPGR